LGTFTTVVAFPLPPPLPAFQEALGRVPVPALSCAGSRVGFEPTPSATRKESCAGSRTCGSRTHPSRVGGFASITPRPLPPPASPGAVSSPPPASPGAVPSPPPAFPGAVLSPPPAYPGAVRLGTFTTVVAFPQHPPLPDFQEALGRVPVPAFSCAGSRSGWYLAPPRVYP
jgi:hypothetical protein